MYIDAHIRRAYLWSGFEPGSSVTRENVSLLSFGLSSSSDDDNICDDNDIISPDNNNH